MLSFKSAGQRVVVGLGDNTLSHPLPELSLRSPKLFSVFADYQRRLFLFLFLLVFVCAHTAFRLPAPDTLRSWCVLPSQRGGQKGETHGTPGKTNIPAYPDQERLPRGSLICEAALSFQSNQLQQQTRYQFCSSPHPKLDEDVT